MCREIKNKKFGFFSKKVFTKVKLSAIISIVPRELN